MGETEPHTPEEWAEYIVDGVRNGTLDSYYESVFRDYIEGTKTRSDEEWVPDVHQLAVYRHNESKGANSSEAEEVYWEQLQDDLSTYLEEDYGTPEEADETLPVVADHQIKTEREYKLGAHKSASKIQSNTEDPWLTTILIQYDEDRPNRYGKRVKYLDEDDARKAVEWLLGNGQTDIVTQLMEEGIRYKHSEQIQAFAAEMAKAGEIDAVRDVKNWAENEHYPDEAGYVRAGITEGLEHGINSSDD